MNRQDTKHAKGYWKNAKEKTLNTKDTKDSKEEPRSVEH